MIDDLYQETILEEYAHPKNKGTLTNADFQQSESNSSCGDQVTVYLQLDPLNHLITEVRWEGVGCAISMALASFLSEEIKGKTLPQLAAYTIEDLKIMIGLDQISPGREKCLSLALVAFQKAISANQDQTA